MCSYQNSPDHEVVIDIVPFPVQGHLNQFLQLACLISSSYDLSVYYVGSSTLNRQARVRANALNPSEIAKIHFHGIPTPEFASPPPDCNALSKFPLHHKPLWDASVASWPMLFHQPKNGFLVKEIWEIGLIVREYEKREELMSASTIENAVSKLMASEQGDIIRKITEELGEAVRRSTEKGGASRMKLDSFVAHLTR